MIIIIEKEDSMIRKAETKDLPYISELVSVPPFTYDSTPYDVEWLSVLIDKGIFLVYESNNIIKGCIVGEKLLCDGCMLWFLVVDKKYQKSIIGSRLYLQFEQDVEIME